MNQEMKKAYQKQKTCAKQRNIEWQFSFEEWCLKWEQSGKWDLRGCSNEKPYQMCRTNDNGPYSFDNTRIDTIWSNLNEIDRTKRKKPIKTRIYPPKQIKPKSLIGKGRPVDSGRLITINGITYPTITKAAKALNIGRTTLIYRLEKGYYK
jgi:hypothetical protein